MQLRTFAGCEPIESIASAIWMLVHVRLCGYGGKQTSGVGQFSRFKTRRQNTVRHRISRPGRL